MFCVLCSDEALSCVLCPVSCVLCSVFCVLCSDGLEFLLCRQALLSRNARLPVTIVKYGGKFIVAGHVMGVERQKRTMPVKGGPGPQVNPADLFSPSEPFPELRGKHELTLLFSCVSSSQQTNCSTVGGLRRRMRETLVCQPKLVRVVNCREKK